MFQVYLRCQCLKLKTGPVIHSKLYFFQVRLVRPLCEVSRDVWFFVFSGPSRVGRTFFPSFCCGHGQLICCTRPATQHIRKKSLSLHFLTQNLCWCTFWSTTVVVRRPTSVQCVYTGASTGRLMGMRAIPISDPYFKQRNTMDQNCLR